VGPTRLLRSAHEVQEPASTFYTPENAPSLKTRLDGLTKTVRAELEAQGFEPARVRVERMLNIRFEGTDTALMVLPSAAAGEVDANGAEDFLKAFRRAYKAEFGFLLEGKPVVVDDVRVRGIGATFDSLGPSVFEELKTLARTRVPADSPKRSGTHATYFERVGRVQTPVFELGRLAVGDEVRGPAVIIDDTQTIVVVPGATAVLARKHLVVTLEDKNS
jgi:5-oxoprolinase (ATP-hydrolysing)